QRQRDQADYLRHPGAVLNKGNGVVECRSVGVMSGNLRLNTPSFHHSISSLLHHPMPPVTLARHAMATRFEIVLHGGNPVALRAAGEEALEEIARLEDQLSLYRPSTEIAHLNSRAAREPV